MRNKENKIICFEHIPKTAGMSVVSALRLYYRKDIQRLIKNKYNYIPENIKVIHGHRALGAQTNIDKKDIKYFTFLREPEKTAVSHFKHIANSIKTEHYKNVKYKGFTFEKYLKEGLFENFDNMAVRRISSIDFPYGKCDEEIYQKAIKNLEEKFFFVGITEYFDESILGLSKILKWEKYPFYIKRNLAIENKYINLGNYGDIFQKINKYDIRLYNLYKSKFLSFMSENKDFYDKNLEIFKKELARFQKSGKFSAESILAFKEKMRKKIKKVIINYL